MAWHAQLAHQLGSKHADTLAVVRAGRRGAKRRTIRRARQQARRAAQQAAQRAERIRDSTM
jgi:hypothetical protein